MSTVISTMTSPASGGSAVEPSKPAKNTRKIFKLIIGGIIFAVILWLGWLGLRWTSPDQRAARATTQAVEYSMAGHHRKAIAAYEESVALRPSRELTYCLATEYLEIGERDHSLSLFRELAKQPDKVGRSAQEMTSILEKDPSYGLHDAYGLGNKKHSKENLKQIKPNSAMENNP